MNARAIDGARRDVRHGLMRLLGLVVVTSLGICCLGTAWAQTPMEPTPAPPAVEVPPPASPPPEAPLESPPPAVVPVPASAPPLVVAAPAAAIPPANAPSAKPDEDDGRVVVEMRTSGFLGKLDGGILVGHESDGMTWGIALDADYNQLGTLNATGVYVAPSLRWVLAKRTRVDVSLQTDAALSKRYVGDGEGFDSFGQPQEIERSRTSSSLYLASELQLSGFF